jgi:hypothetical protein
MSDQLLPPNEATTGIDTYTKWVTRKWLVIISTGEFAVFLVIWRFTGGKIADLPTYISISLLIFIILVYVATHQLWEAERKDKLSIIEDFEKAKAQIEQIISEKDKLDQTARHLQISLLQLEKDRKPNLYGYVEDIQFYTVYDSEELFLLGTRISLYLGIANASPVPTTIRGFKLDVVNKDNGHFIGNAGLDPAKFGFLQQECIISQSVLANGNYRLADRFASGQVAELGIRHEGGLFFDFNLIQNPDENFDWSNNIILKVIDAFDEEHQIEGGLLKKYDKAD